MKCLGVEGGHILYLIGGKSVVTFETEDCGSHTWVMQGKVPGDNVCELLIHQGCMWDEHKYQPTYVPQVENIGSLSDSLLCDLN